MPDDSSNPDIAEWTRALDRAQLEPSHRAAVKLRGRHIALFLHHGEVFACNNRCPHEGYPLVEGALSEREGPPSARTAARSALCAPSGGSERSERGGPPSARTAARSALCAPSGGSERSERGGPPTHCVLTCHWHNWKFDLKTGATIYGGDSLRVYPVKVEDGAVWVDLRDPPAALRIGNALHQLDHAMAEYDTPRIARELARLGKAGTGPEIALARAIAATHAHLKDGMTHAYAAADVWLRLGDSLADDVHRLACATEALGYIAYDTLREPSYPYTDVRSPWDGEKFAAAIETQDENAAVALVNGALAQGLHFGELELALARASLAHYNDFGHSLIYLTHVQRLIERLGTAVEAPLLKAWVRSLIYATREDLLPDFRGYADALAVWPADTRPAGTLPHAGNFEGRSVRHALSATVAAAGCAPIDVYFALMEAAARHLLRFDERHALRTDNTVADNVGWLDFTHALTFGHAVRQHCERYPDLWRQGLLQLAMFVGRNSGYLDPNLDAQRAIDHWAVVDEAAFHERAKATLVDHGIGLPILPSHWLKTWSAVSEEGAAGLPAHTQGAMLAAMNRLLAVRFKERHALRVAHQALSFVAKED